MIGSGLSPCRRSDDKDRISGPKKRWIFWVRTVPVQEVICYHFPVPVPFFFPQIHEAQKDGLMDGLRMLIDKPFSRVQRFWFSFNY
jgi:hypothetical protein